MATITITSQIVSGNLGDGWIDNNEAAQGLAEYTEKQWLDDLSSLTGNHEVVIDIDVARNAVGVCRETDVSIDGVNSDDYDASYEFTETVKSLLTDENEIWGMFCESGAATAYI